ncbi:hypothetical protein FSP39_017927 [Pinctada imbricata]|uniref:Phosphatidic acid phosphatase type 2/haloperoxidase domain-containing protein n=1 Tax=Pinctada imbricata TaxID=66713 RepID=A0AA89C285_PINIB|nr:hypothetical protein FSP39_017927 [Pinctada imbricata]
MHVSGTKPSSVILSLNNIYRLIGINQTMSNDVNHKELLEHIKKAQEEYATDLQTYKRNRTSVLIIVTCLLELMVLVFVIAMEMVLRFTTIFPYRRQNFSCIDAEISKSSSSSEYSGFAFQGRIPDSVIYSLSFCIPPVVICVGEIGMWSFTQDKQKSIRVLCRPCSVPQVVRRMIRFVGVFVFGACCMLVFVDVIKLVTGRLRPNFLEVCRVNRTLCKEYSNFGNDRLCDERDEMKLKDARTSFPSIAAALTSYSAVFVSTYIHGALQSRSVRVLRPFLTLVFIMLAMVSGLVEVGVNYSHWTDVLAGFVIGVAMAIYLSSYVLQKFHEYIAERQVLSMLHQFLLEHHLLVALTKQVISFKGYM